MITFYGYAPCSTSKKAEKILKDEGINYEFVDITVTPPSVDLFRSLLLSTGLPLKKLFNTSGVQYRERGIKDLLPSLSEEEALALLSSDGRLVKRPIAVSGQKFTVGFSEADFREMWCK